MVIWRMNKCHSKWVTEHKCMYFLNKFECECVWVLMCSILLCVHYCSKLMTAGHSAGWMWLFYFVSNIVQNEWLQDVQLGWMWNILLCVQYCSKFMTAEHSSGAPQLCWRWWCGWGSGSADWSYFTESAGSV